MNPSRLFRVDREEGALVIVPQLDMGELNCDQIKEASQVLMEEVEQATEKSLVVDFGRNDYFGSDALGLFVRLWKKTGQRGGRIAFCGASPYGEEVLRRARFDHLGTICTNREEALKAVQPG